MRVEALSTIMKLYPSFCSSKMLFIALVLLGGVRSEKVGRQGLNANNCQIVCSGAECTTQCDMPAEIVETLSPPVPEQFSPVTFSEAEQHELRIALIFHYSPESNDDVASFYKDYQFLIGCWAKKHHLTVIVDRTPLDVLPFMENVPADLTRYRGWWGQFFAARSYLKDYDGVFVLDSDTLVTHWMWDFDPRNLLRWYTEDILIGDQCGHMHAWMHTQKIARLHACLLAQALAHTRIYMLSRARA